MTVFPHPDRLVLESLDDGGQEMLFDNRRSDVRIGLARPPARRATDRVQPRHTKSAVPAFQCLGDVRDGFLAKIAQAVGRPDTHLRRIMMHEIVVPRCRHLLLAGVILRGVGFTSLGRAVGVVDGLAVGVEHLAVVLAEEPQGRAEQDHPDIGIGKHLTLGLELLELLGEILLARPTPLSVMREAGTGRNNPTHDNIFFQTFKVIILSFDGSQGQNLGCLLERCG